MLLRSVNYIVSTSTYMACPLVRYELELPGCGRNTPCRFTTTLTVLLVRYGLSDLQESSLVTTSTAVDIIGLLARHLGKALRFR